MSLRNIFYKLAHDVSRYPNIVQLTNTLDHGFKEVAEHIQEGGGGSSVEVTTTQVSGNKIAAIRVDGEDSDIYAPDPSLSISGNTLSLYKGTPIDVPSTVELPGDNVTVNPIQETGTIIAEITVNDVTSQIRTPNVTIPVHAYSTTEQIVGKWLDNSDIYERAYVFDNALTVSYQNWTDTTISKTGIDKIINATAYTTNGKTFWNVDASVDISSYVSLLSERNGDTISVKTLILQYTKS